MERRCDRCGVRAIFDAGRRALQGESIHLDRILNVCLFFQSPGLSRLHFRLDCRIAASDPAHARLFDVTINHLVIHHYGCTILLRIA